MRRRRFLTFVAASPVLLAGCRRNKAGTRHDARPRAARKRCAVEQRSAGPGRVLKAGEWEAIEAVAETIFPAGEGGAGAREANVVNYIDQQLLHPPTDAFAPLIRFGARYLDARAKAQGARSFARLSGEKRQRLLRKLERGRLGRYRGSRFVAVMVSMTLEGMFGDPIYGGNRERVGWKLIGFSPQAPGPHCPYRGRV